MVLTPSFYVFKMYTAHHDATLLPTYLECEDYIFEEEKIPAVNASASIDKEGFIHISLCNLNPEKNIKISCDIRGTDISGFTGQILTAEKINDFNDFGKEEKVFLTEFTNAKLDGNKLIINLPSKSVVMLELK